MAKALLSEMLVDLRAEVGHSLMLGQGTNMEETLKYYLKRTQRELYTAFDWPQFMVYERLDVAAGDRFLTAFTNIDDEQVNTLWCRVGSTWQPLIFGIHPANFSIADPDQDSRSFPVTNYQYNELQGNLEIWPIPSVDTSILAYGQIKLPDLVDLTDSSLLDGQLIVMFAAANILARQKDEDASLVLNKAQQYLVSIQKQNGSQKRVPRSMAWANGGRRPRPGLDYIPPGMPRP